MTAPSAAPPPGAAAEAVLARAAEAGAPPPPQADQGCEIPEGGRKTRLALALTALGVVYGDIGTSPLYALKECFAREYGLEHTAPVVLGVLSLIVWSLTLVVGVKYVLFIMRADNRGEGGILALVALLSERIERDETKAARGRPRLARPGVLVALGLFAAALLYGDGIITPAISVLSAVEGLALEAPRLGAFVVPLALVLLFALFVVQRRGTARIGRVFGPVMLLWFVTLGALGLVEVVQHPAVLAAVDPRHAVRFFAAHGLTGLLVLGAVVLAVTGAEALYADMGHCGRRPIQLVWFGIVFPALLLNYFGQGSLVLRSPAAVANPFYLLAPRWATYPLVALATVATIIASQALISGAFSLTRQLVHLGYSPLVTIHHTSAEQEGQVYIPEVNYGLMAGCLLLVVAFRSSTALAAAYGIAVTGTMAITTILFYALMRRCWGWSLLRAGALALLFLAVDLAFLAANALKVAHGGWIPLAVAAVLFAIFTTWRAGRARLVERRRSPLSIDELLASLAREEPHRTPGTGVFVTLDPSGVPRALLHALEHLHVLPERVVLLVPVATGLHSVPASERVSVETLNEGFVRVVARYGYAQAVNVADVMLLARMLGVETDPATTTFFLADERIVPGPARGLARWRQRLFILMERNAPSMTDFFRIPRGRVVELGTQVEL